MLTTLMDISEAETGTMKLNVSQVELAKLAEGSRDLYEDTAEDAGVALHVSVPAGLVVAADRDRLRQALANLVDNAIKYTPRGGRVDLVRRQRLRAVVDDPRRATPASAFTSRTCRAFSTASTVATRAGPPGASAWD